MSSQPTVLAQPCMCCLDGGGICCGRHTGQWYKTTMYNKYKIYCTIHNTDTVAYAMHSDYYIVLFLIYIVQFLQGDYSTLVLFLGKRRICNNQLMCGSVKVFDYDLIESRGLGTGR